MQINRSLGYIMFMVGLGMLLVSFVFPMVTVIVDTTPPKWVLDQYGSIVGGIVPSDGQTYSTITQVAVCVYDDESGVASIKAMVDSTTYDCTQTEGFANGNGWWKSPVFATLPSGSHSIKVVATNYAGLSTTYSGTFIISTVLAGNWFVSGQAVTKSSQVIYVTSTTVTFQFDETSGVDDSKIICTVVEGSTTLLTLTNTAANTWKGSYTFSVGTHTLQLKASDGTQTVTMSVINIQIGPTPLKLPQVNTLQILGLASTGIGLLLIFTGRKKGGR